MKNVLKNFNDKLTELNETYKKETKNGGKDAKWVKKSAPQWLNDINWAEIHACKNDFR